MKNQSNQVKERPIIFSGEMVKAILDGKKTMTRRVVKTQPSGECTEIATSACFGHVEYRSTSEDRHTQSILAKIKCPYGKVGDRLWVRENWQEIGPDCLLTYKATYPSDLYAKRPELENVPPLAGLKERGYLWKSPMFMPRWASRILLEITDIRVERLQDISDGDAVKEGVHSYTSWCSSEGEKTVYQDYSMVGNVSYNNPVDSFRTLWDSLYDENSPKCWSNNPWVWVVEFKVIKGE